MLIKVMGGKITDIITKTTINIVIPIIIMLPIFLFILRLSLRQFGHKYLYDISSGFSFP